MLRSASRWAIDSRKGCRIPAPAPCASTYSSRAPPGRSSSPDTSPARSPTTMRSSTEAAMELLERCDEIGLELEHRAQRVVLQLLHPRRGGLDRELLDVELRGHLAPLERHRHRRARQWPRAEGRDEQSPVAVLHVVEVHLAVPLLDLACDRGDLRQLRRDDARQESPEGAGLFVGHLAAQRDQDVKAGRATRLDARRQTDIIAQR